MIFLSATTQVGVRLINVTLLQVTTSHTDCWILSMVSLFLWKEHNPSEAGLDINMKPIPLTLSFLFRAFPYSNYIFNFRTECTSTISFLYYLLNKSYKFLCSLRQAQGGRTPTNGTEKEHILPQHYDVI
jgi:hypothetical protein